LSCRRDDAPRRFTGFAAVFADAPPPFCAASRGVSMLLPPMPIEPPLTRRRADTPTRLRCDATHFRADYFLLLILSPTLR